MSDEVTPYLGLIKPEVGASDDTWGDKTNHNWDLVDAAIFAIPPPGSGGGGGGTILISETPPSIVTTPVGSLWWESDTGSMYILYDDGTSKQWVFVAGGGFVVFPSNTIPIMDGTGAVGTSAYYARGDHVHPSDTTKMSKSANLSDVSNSVTARQNIYAAPFDAMAYNGMQINGSMEISQENGTTAQTVAFKWVCDGWTLSFNGTMALSATQAINGTQISGIPNCVVIATTTAQASIGAGNLAGFQTKIEGYRAARLGFGTSAASPVTVAFWTAHVRTGTYSVSIRNGAGNRSCVASYTQNAASTWEYKTVTFPGCTDGGWANDNATGLLIDFSFAAGTTFTALAAGIWYSTNYVAAPGQVNAVAATSDVFRITGVVVLPGIEAPSASRSPLIMRPYDQELVTCKRYYSLFQFPASAVIVDGNSAAASQNANFTFPMLEMRSNPTGQLFGTPSSSNISNPTTPGFIVSKTIAFASWQATGTGRYFVIANASGTTFTLDARL